MAKALTPQDCHVLMEELVKQATGQNSFGSVTVDNFVSAGELVLSTGKENTLNALSLLIGRTMIAVRPYSAKLALLNSISTGAYTDRLRKISYYTDDPLPAGDWNTQLYTNLYEGYDNGSNGGASVGSMWEQHYKTPLEVFFSGSNVWDYVLTITENQLKKAFRDEASFGEFVAGMMTEMSNDIAREKEAFNRLTLLNYMAGVYDMDAPGSKVNMTTAYNTYFGTNYTTQELLTDHLTSFLEFFVSEFKKISDLMTYSTVNFHSFPAITGKAVLRHTPKDRQRLFMFNDFLRKAEAMVKPAIFNPQYLDMDKQFEGVEFWQSINDPASISVVPGISDFDSTSATYGTQIAGSAVSEDYVIGFLYDVDGCMVNFMLDQTATSPLEARKLYRNLHFHFMKQACADYSENAVIFFMNDDDVTP